MAETTDHIRQTIRFFEEKLATHGATAQGIDYNSTEAVHARYKQVLRAMTRSSGFSVNDFGCGFGGIVGYMDANGFSDFDYTGYDVTEAMVTKAREIYGSTRRRFVVGDQTVMAKADYTVAGGVFNMKLATPVHEWSAYVRQCLTAMYEVSTIAASANFLTSYSDADRMRDDLYYPDPGEIFAFAKSLSRNVALLHDYDLYDFTIISSAALPSDQMRPKVGNQPVERSLAGRWWRFVVTGVLVNVSLLGFLWLLLRTGMDYRIASTLSFVTGVLWGYLQNRLWSWKSDAAIIQSTLKYFIAYGCLYLAHMAIVITLVSRLGLTAVAAAFVSVAILTAPNFFVLNRLVFRRRSD
jgi:putative flippase GtrA